MNEALPTFTEDENEDDAYEFENIEGIKNTPNEISINTRQKGTPLLPSATQ